MSSSTLVFSHLPTDILPFAPRLGSLSLQRRDGHVVDIKTPGFITTTSRGVIPHLSRDHVQSTNAIKWTHIPFESFLDHVPPVLTLQTGPDPLHTFLGYNKGQHILSMSVRDPLDRRDMPANGKDHINAYCIRGVRKVTPTAWKSYSQLCKPDIIVALSDVPYTPAAQSQKRLQKSLERSTAWLSQLLASNDKSTPSEQLSDMPSVLVNLVGGTDARARTTFSEGLVEVLHGKEQEQISPLRTLDEGVTGYQFELVALRSTLRKEHNQDPQDDDQEETEKLKNLLKASLGPLPTGKLRVTYGSSSPHEILNLIRDVGVDLFDVHWAQHAAEIGVALDFRFPAPNPSEVLWAQHPCPKPRSRTSHTIDVGHNLFSHDYAHDHSRLASSFLDGSCHSQLSATTNVDAPWCPCGACTPVPFTTSLTHDRLTQPPGKPTSTLPPYTRSYIHHLLHTHEMSSHTLLAMHNFFIMDAFFSGIRDVLHRSQTEAGLFEREVERFVATYEDPRRLFTETEKDWAKVESERGKGRLAREKAAQEESEAVVQDVEVV